MPQIAVLKPVWSSAIWGGACKARKGSHPSKGNTCTKSTSTC